MGPHLGWLLLGAGMLLLYGYSIYDFMTDASEPVWVRLALGGIGLGSVSYTHLRAHET